MITFSRLHAGGHRVWSPALITHRLSPAVMCGFPAVAFQATESDVPVYILAPRSLGSEALSRNVESVAQQGANLRVFHEPSEIHCDAQMPPLVLNWGGSEALPADLVALNRPDAEPIASDQVESTLLLEAGVDVKTVSERLGHDSVQTTLELCGHVTQTMRSNAASRIGSLLNTARTPVAAVTAEK